MKKRTLPNSETLKQYIFDYGMDKACELWNITPDEANKILNPTFKDIHYKYIREKKYKKLNPEYIKIKKIIAENYELIYNRMNKHKKEDIYLMCEAKKDFYHNAIRNIMESDIEDITL